MNTVIKTLTKIELDLVPTYHSEDPPVINYGIDIADTTMVVDRPLTLEFLVELDPGPHSLIVEFVNKKDEDCIPNQGLDKTIGIGQVRFDGLTSPNFNYMAEYYPIYPEPWYSEQDPKPDPVHKAATLMGWNGRWKLDFNAPVFFWTSKVGNIRVGRNPNQPTMLDRLKNIFKRK